MGFGRLSEIKGLVGHRIGQDVSLSPECVSWHSARKSTLHGPLFQDGVSWKKEHCFFYCFVASSNATRTFTPRMYEHDPRILELNLFSSNYSLVEMWSIIIGETSSNSPTHGSHRKKWSHIDMYYINRLVLPCKFYTKSDSKRLSLLLGSCRISTNYKTFLISSRSSSWFQCA